MDANNSNIIEPLFEKAKEYGKTSFELMKLKALEKGSNIASSIVLRMTFFLLLSVFFLLASIGLAILLGDVLGKVWYGFFVVAGGYAFIALVINYFLYKRLKALVRNYFIRVILK